MTRTIQPDDLLNLRFLNGAALSPDASQVIYTVYKINAEDDREYSTMYLLDLASGGSRQMTGGRAIDAGRAGRPMAKRSPLYRIAPASHSCICCQPTVAKRGS